jgi:uracil-DNA glycosylase
MLVGQAPGIDEYKSGKAFQGQAGKDIRLIFNGVGVDADKFDQIVYQTSVTKCFPGRKLARRKDKKNGEVVEREEDLQPSSAEIRSCIPFLERQISVIKPSVIVLLGKTAIDGYLRLLGRKYSGNLQTYIGRTEEAFDASIIFFPHTSGSSRWLNDLQNRKLFNEAKSLLRQKLRDHAIVP